MSEEPRVLLGRYRLLSVLGRGGMGQYTSGPDESWQDDSLPVFDAAAATFAPSG